MPLIEDINYSPPFWLKNAHLNTFYPYLFRKNHTPDFSRQRYQTPDDDFFDTDWICEGSKKRLCILLHGLEGSSSSQYIRGMAKILADRDYHVVALNFRSCSGEINKQVGMYHSGFTKDLHFFVQEIEKLYDEIFICGFSLGGNVTMKYLGDHLYPLSDKIKAAAGISVPVDLRAGSIKIMEIQNRVYEKKFLGTLTSKVKLKNKLHPELIDISNLKKVKTLWDFDEYYTSSLHGFNDAEDYYRQCNSKQFLTEISKPVLIINALDDSFLPEDSYPYEAALKNDHVFLMTPKYGGHVGFTTFGTSYYWSETTVLNFFTQYSSQ